LFSYLADFGTDTGIGRDIAQGNLGQFTTEALLLINRERIWVNGQCTAQIIVNE
jgi:hypothetical protein